MVQLTKGFEESDKGQASRLALKSGHLAHSKQLLSVHLDTKWKGVAALKVATDAKHLLALTKPVVQECYKVLKDPICIPEMVEDKDGNIHIRQWVQSTILFTLTSCWCYLGVE